MIDQDRFHDLLDQWEAGREQGQEPSAAELCKDCPELEAEVVEAINALKATDWMMKPDDDEDDSFLSLPPQLTKKRFAVPKSISLEDFSHSIIDSGLLTADQLQRVEATDANDLAAKLIQAKQITEYQARQICDGNTKGLVLGNYVILDEIGSGGMGAVFKARHTRMKRIVALKILPEKAVDSPTAVERFHREVEAAARLEHPNIVTAYDADECDGTHFFVMQCVDGTDLSSLVKKKGRMPIGKAVDCIIQAAKGLEYAHQEGVIHRDIKPANLLLNSKGVAKILDMGLARLEAGNEGDALAATQAELTQDGAVMGTVDYMSPEQALDTHQADARADMYSLGCTLYYLLAGQPIYGGSTLMAKMLAHREKQIPSLREERDDVPEQLETVFNKMVAKNPEERYPTMTALLEDLESLVGEYEETWVSDADDTTAVEVESDVEIQAKDTSSAHVGDTLEIAPKSKPDAAPVPAMRAAGFSNRRFIAGGVAVVLLAVLGYFLYGITIRVQTDDGTILIESSHPDIEVFVDGKQVVHITDPNDKKKIKVEIPKGATTLRVSKAGFEADVKEFKLNSVKGSVKVSFVPVDKASAVAGDVDWAAEREVAEWVLEMKGVFWTHDSSVHDDTVPEGHFQIATLSITGKHTPRAINEAEASRLTRLEGLISLNFTNNPHVSDQTIKAIRPLTITGLHLAKTHVTDEGLRDIPVSVGQLYLSGTSIGDKGFKYLNDLPRLGQIIASNTRVTDEGIKHFAEHPLTYLDLNNCEKISDES